MKLLIAAIAGAMIGFVIGMIMDSSIQSNQRRPFVDLQIEEPCMPGDTLCVLYITDSTFSGHKDNTQDTIAIGYLN